MVRKILAFVLMGGFILNIATSVYAEDFEVQEELKDVYEEYKDDEQFQMMLQEYGDEYATQFLEDVLNNSYVDKARGGGGNICYQYVTNIKQTKDNNCGSTTVLQTLYGLGSQNKVSGSTDKKKLKL